MRTKIPIYYWDTCVFLAWIKREEKEPNEMAGLREIAAKINNHEALLITSSIIDSEILQCTLDSTAQNMLNQIFKRRNFRKINTTNRVWTLAGEIRDYYQKRKEIDNLPTVTTPDSVHLATAILYEADEMHTYDQNNLTGKRRALTPLSGNVAGIYRLTICKPLPIQLAFL